MSAIVIVHMEHDNFDIKRNPRVREKYPALYRAIVEHDRMRFSSEYELPRPAYEEYLRYLHDWDIPYMPFCKAQQNMPPEKRVVTSEQGTGETMPEVKATVKRKASTSDAKAAKAPGKRSSRRKAAIDDASGSNPMVGTTVVESDTVPPKRIKSADIAS